ncbi:hypothetical protein D3C85_1875230 [compost metagenome]
MVTVKILGIHEPRFLLDIVMFVIREFSQKNEDFILAHGAVVGILLGGWNGYAIGETIFQAVMAFVQL